MSDLQSSSFGEDKRRRAMKTRETVYRGKVSKRSETTETSARANKEARSKTPPARSRIKLAIPEDPKR